MVSFFLVLFAQVLMLAGLNGNERKYAIPAHSERLLKFCTLGAWLTSP